MSTQTKTYSDLALLIREKRRKSGLTQEQLAEKAGVSQNYIAKIETGAANVGIKTLAKLAVILDIPTENLIEFNMGMYEDMALLIDKRLDLDGNFHVLPTRMKDILLKFVPILEKYV